MVTIQKNYLNFYRYKSFQLSTQGLKKINAPFAFWTSTPTIMYHNYINNNLIVVSPMRSKKSFTLSFFPLSAQVSSGFYRNALLSAAAIILLSRFAAPSPSSSSSTAGRRSLAPMSVERSNFVISGYVRQTPSNVSWRFVPRVSLASSSAWSATPRRRLQVPTSTSTSAVPPGLPRGLSV